MISPETPIFLNKIEQNGYTYLVKKSYSNRFVARRFAFAIPNDYLRFTLHTRTLLSTSLSKT